VRKHPALGSSVCSSSESSESTSRGGFGACSGVPNSHAATGIHALWPIRAWRSRWSAATRPQPPSPDPRHRELVDQLTPDSLVADRHRVRRRAGTPPPIGPFARSHCVETSLLPATRRAESGLADVAPIDRFLCPRVDRHRSRSCFVTRSFGPHEEIARMACSSHRMDRRVHHPYARRYRSERGRVYRLAGLPLGTGAAVAILCRLVFISVDAIGAAIGWTVLRYAKESPLPATSVGLEN